MKNLLLLLLLTLSLSAHAQKMSKDFIPREIEIGRYNDGRIIKGLEFDPDYTIAAYGIDTQRQEILFELVRGSYSAWDGNLKIAPQIALFDLKTNSMRWIKKFRPLKDFRFVFSKSRFIQNVPGAGSACFDKKDASMLWECKKQIQVTNDKYNIAVSAGGSAIDLTTGETRWSRHISDNWKSVIYPYEETMAIISDEVHFFHLSDGSGWDYKGKITPEGSSEFNKTTSNIVYENGKLFCASASNMVCLDTAGHEIWKTPFPENTASVSHLMATENYLLMLNYVMDHEGNWKGVPFIAAYNKTTGAQKYLSVIEMKERIFIPYTSGNMPFIINDEAIVFSCKHVIYKYNLLTGEKILEVNTSVPPFNWYYMLLHPAKCYVKKGEDFENAWGENSGNIFWLSDDNDILITDWRFRPVDSISKDKWWRFYNKKGDVSFIQKDGKTLVIKNGKKIATLKLMNAEIAGDKIFSVADSHFAVAEISNLFN
jgi:outer membrane protein assembly factor BamB